MRIAHNSKLKIQNSKLPLSPTRQHKPTATATEELATKIQCIEGIREVGALLQGQRVLALGLLLLTLVFVESFV